MRLNTIFRIMTICVLGKCVASYCQPNQNVNFQQVQVYTPSRQVDIAFPPFSNAYPLTEDSKFHPGVPKGTTFTFVMKESHTFPNTSRHITVYVPAQYTTEKPACVFVLLDSFGYNAPAVFDNLIAEHAMPVTIGIGVEPGTSDSINPPDHPRFDRSMEFDTRSGRFARFLLEEVIPEVERQKAPDGRAIHLSTDPNDRGIGGGSTGGIAAFTVAWERPDAFRRVFTSIGTFVGMRGGEEYHVLVRKTEPKPIRIFMQDGIYDELPGIAEVGDWALSNQTMERALTYAGYEVRHAWGTGGHDGNQAAAIFPDALRWLWKDWPAPIHAGISSNPMLKEVIDPNESWRLLAEGCATSTELTTGPDGSVFISQPGVKGVSPMPVRFSTNSCVTPGKKSPSLAFGPGGEVFFADEQRGGVLLSKSAKPPVRIAARLRVTSMTASVSGNLYVTGRDGERQGVWLIRPGQSPLAMLNGLKNPSGISLSPDGLWLFIAQREGHRGYSCRVLKDGAIDACEPFYEFYVPASSDDSGAGSVAMDRDGRAYVATSLGVQIVEHNGRAVGILPLPANEPATGLCFGGPDFSTLYVLSGGKVYSRRLLTKGMPPAAEPIHIDAGSAG